MIGKKKQLSGKTDSSEEKRQRGHKLQLAESDLRFFAALRMTGGDRII